MSKSLFKRWWWLAAVGLIVVAIAATLTSSRWLPAARRLVASRGTAAKAAAHAHEAAGAAHDEHDEDGKADTDHDAEAKSGAHAGEEPGAHAGEEPGVHAGEKPDAHAGEKADAHAGVEPDAHAGEAPDAHAGEAPDAHAGEAPGAHAAHAGEKLPAYNHKHDDAAAMKLSSTAQENVGLKLAKVKLGVFERTVTVPAMIVERPGRSNLLVAAPMTGVITKIWPIRGETVSAGQPLFDIRLTHEEIVVAQGQFLRTVEELDVVRREMKRLEGVAAKGAIPGKTVLDREYEQQKLEALLRSQRQQLLLHGLTDPQVDEIVAKRTLFSQVTVSVPQPNDAVANKPSDRVLQVEELNIDKGQHVTAGQSLCVLADYAELYVEGKAFEEDGAVLDRAAQNDWRATVVVPANGKKAEMFPGLSIVYLDNKVDPESRAQRFYVQLGNKLNFDRTQDGHRFSGWQFKPGQRVQILVPAERWADRIVLPIDAVIQEGPESYVFEQNEGHFDRRSVRVEYRDQYSVVLANDGSIALGGTVIVAGAYQVHLALRNKSGGAPDPHAGHNH